MKYFRMLVFVVLLSSCVTHAEQENSVEEITQSEKKVVASTEQAKQIVDAPAISLVVPAKETVLQKNIDEAVLEKIVYGSPDSLYAAFMELGEHGTAGDKTKELYLELISRIMQLVYPFDSRIPEYRAYTGEHVYLEGLKQVVEKKYPFAMQTTDFLSTIIPTFVLISDGLAHVDSSKIERRLELARSYADKSVLLNYLTALFNTQKYNDIKAHDLYREAWLADNSCYPAGLAYAELLSKSGAHADAIAIIESLLVKYPGQTAVELRATKIYTAAKDWAKAEKILATVQQKDPTNEAATLLRIYVLLEEKEYLKANALLDTYKEKNKTNKDYLLLRARLATEWSKDFPKTLELLQSAYDLYPADTSVLLTCAKILFESGKSMNGKNAIDFIRALLALSPQDSEALELLVHYYLAQKQYNKALESAQAFARLYPSEQADILLVRAYVGVKQGGNAVGIARRLYAQKQNETAIELYALALHSVKNYASLQTVINKHLERASSRLKSKLYYHSAVLAVSDDARVAAYRASLLANPQNEDSLYALYRQYYNQKNYQKAHYYLKQILAIKENNRRYLQLEKELRQLLAE